MLMPLKAEPVLLLGLFCSVILSGSGVRHVCRHAAGKPQSRVPAFVHNGRACESGGDRNQSAVLGELGVSVPAVNTEPEGKRSTEDEDEGDEE